MTSQYGTYALHAGLARLHALFRMHTHAGTRTNRPISNTYCFSPATVIRERASVLRYTYIACLFFLYYYTTNATNCTT
jgi:hypothetical protein